MQKPSNTTGYISYSKRKDIHTEFASGLQDAIADPNISFETSLNCRHAVFPGRL